MHRLLSAAQGILPVDPRNHFMHRLQVRLHHLLTRGIVIVVSWIPSHMGIPGNELADQSAKSASTAVPEFICCPYTAWTPCIQRVIYARWGERWNCGDRHGSGAVQEVGGSCKLPVVGLPIYWPLKPYSWIHYGACSSTPTSLPAPGATRRP